MTEENRNETQYQDELMELDKIDEIMERTGMEFLEAKAKLDENNGSVIAAITRIEQERQEKREAKKAELKEKYWDNTKDNIENLKGYVKEKCDMVNPEELVEEIKTGLKKPVSIGQVGNKKVQFPAGVVGAGIVTALYPFHRSKALTAASAAALGAWFFGSNHGLSKTKMAIKKATEEFKQENGGAKEFTLEINIEKAEDEEAKQAAAKADEPQTEAAPETTEAFRTDDENREDKPDQV